jgi:endogenous inhibitor of DNA gyrase (YacG/DUF329 family)
MRKPRRLTCKQCRKRLPKIALIHGDPYCSTRCAQKAHGVAG